MSKETAGALGIGARGACTVIRVMLIVVSNCNDLWLQLITVSLCDGLIRRMYVERERENSAHERGRAYFARPSRVSQLSLALGHCRVRDEESCDSRVAHAS